MAKVRLPQMRHRLNPNLRPYEHREAASPLTSRMLASRMFTRNIIPQNVVCYRENSGGFGQFSPGSIPADIPNPSRRQIVYHNPTVKVMALFNTPELR